MSELDRAMERLHAKEVNRRSLLKGLGIAGAGAAAFSVAGITQAEIVSGPSINARRQDGTPVTGGVLVLMGHQEIPGLSPEDGTATIPWTAVAQIHNAVVQQDANLNFQPVLATELPTPSEDGLTWTIKLRQDVTFSDGEPFTSEDVKYTYDWVMNPDNGSVFSADFNTVQSVETPDDYTVVVTLNQPNAAFMSQVAAKFIVPAHYHGQVGEEAYKAAPIGTGPFVVNSFSPTESVLLDAWDGHFRGRPNIDQVRFDVVPLSSVRAEALENGDADNSIWPLSPEEDQRLEESGEFTTYTTLNFAVNHFPLNNEHPILSDKRVRQAMMYAIDRQLLIDEIFLGNAVLATSNLSPAMGDFYNPDVVQYPYDVDAANALLDEAGWVMNDDGMREKDGQPLTFTCFVITDDSARRPEAEVVQQMLAEVGIDMQLQEAPVSQILEQLPAGEIDAALFNWSYGDSADPDATSTLHSTGASNFSNFKTERVDELLEQGLAVTDREARIPIYHEIQAIVADEVPFLFIMYWNAKSHFSKRVQGLPPVDSVLTTDNIYPQVYTLWIEEPA